MLLFWHFPDFTRGFILETDASGAGLGAILAQSHKDEMVHPIAYASRTLQQHEKNYAITELEAPGIVWAVKHFHHYLYGHHCEVHTDHKPLIALLNTPHPSGKLARWGLTLQDVDLAIRYHPGRKNAGADALSRLPVHQDDDGDFSLSVQQVTEDLHDNEVSVTAAVMEDNAKSRERCSEEKNTNKSTSSCCQQAQELNSENMNIRDRQQKDPKLKLIMDYLEKGDLPKDDKNARELVLGRSLYQVIEGILYHMEPDKSLHLIPPNVDQERLFHEVHGGIFAPI